MANYILTCLLAAVVACGIISVITNFLSEKLQNSRKFKTFISIVIEIIVSGAIFILNAVLTDNSITYTILTTAIGVVIVVAFSQIAYSTIIKLITKLISLLKEAIKSE